MFFIRRSRSVSKLAISFIVAVLAIVVLRNYSENNISDVKISNKKQQNKPKIIGVIGDYLENKNNENNYANWPLHVMRFQYIDNFVKACAGKNVAFVMLTNTTEQAKKVADAVDAIILTGGGDDLTGRRDEFEKQMILNIVKQRKPIFGICRGLQMINDVLGGDIVRLDDAYPNHLKHKTANYCMECNKTQHKVLLQENSLINKILNKKQIDVNTNHNDGIKKIGKGIVVSGFAEDGVPESIEMKDYPTFFLGVQWHPEFLATKDDKKIVQAFCDAVVDNNN